MAGFEGFPRDFFRFFQDLERNNNRPWFQDNKQRYLDSVVSPMSAFIVAIAPRLERISEHYRADRIYRDTRFSKDKTPYKTHAASHFRHEAGRDAHAPGFYAHFARNGLFFGGGIWRPPNTHLNVIREAIADNPRAWAAIRGAKAIRDRGGLQGDSLKRAPRGFDPEHRHIEDLKRKSFYVMAEAEPALAHTPELLNEVAAAFRASARNDPMRSDSTSLWVAFPDVPLIVLRELSV